MEYIILPSERYEQADKALAKRLGLDQPRRSIDGSQIIMHLECYHSLFAYAPAVSSTISQPDYPIYDSNDEALKRLLESEAWSAPAGGLPE